MKTTIARSLAILLFGIPCQSGAAVVFSNDIRTIGVTPSGGSPYNLEIDFNSDDRIDFRIVLRSDIIANDIIVTGPETTLFLTAWRVSAQGVLGTGLISLSSGERVGSVLGDDFTFVRFPSGGNDISYAETSERPVISTGPFANKTAYLGFQFGADDGIHYGYALIQDHATYGATIHETGWETIPGKAILTGAVPEPSTSLFALGAIVIGAFSRRRSPASA